jgi:DNA-binding response OmpR family regulator
MRLLLIERDKSTAQSLQASLENMGFTVATASQADGSDSRRELGGGDAIVLSFSRCQDFELSVIQQWRERAPNALILTLIPQECTVEEKIRCLDVGADGYVIRPPDPKELSARLRALGRRRQLAEPVIRTHDLEIDLRTWQVRRGGQVIVLTPREFALLHLLASRQGQIVTRSMIHDHLYNNGFNATSNVVDVYIRYLRQKIDKGFDTPLIMTFRGQGYQLRADATSPSTSPSGVA